MKETKIIILTGGSSGIGKATADILCAGGHRVYEFSRHAPAEQNGSVHMDVDVTDEEQTVRAVREVAEKEGRIDILINCAGFGISGAVEFTGIEEAKRQLDVNFFGTVRMIRAVLPYMREKKSGRIVNISSVAAPAAIPFQRYYSVSKASINSITLSLANEVRRFGIRVCAVMPGDTRTGFTAARHKIPEGDDIYGGVISRSVRTMEHDETNGMSAVSAGKVIARAALSNSGKPLYTIGLQYKFLVFLLKILPVRTSTWIIGKLYA